MIKEEQRRVHNTKHYENGDGRVFIPQWRIRAIRHETDVANSIIKREGGKIHTGTCRCGSIDCINYVGVSQPAVKSVAPKPKKLKRHTYTPTEIKRYDI